MALGGKAKERQADNRDTTKEKQQALSNFNVTCLAKNIDVFDVFIFVISLMVCDKKECELFNVFMVLRLDILGSDKQNLST